MGMPRVTSETMVTGRSRAATTIHLRPAIICATVLVAAVSMLGGVVLDLSAQSSVMSALDKAEIQAEANLRESLEQADDNLNRTVVQARDNLRESLAAAKSNVDVVVAQARESLTRSIDDGSNADILLFSYEILQTFKDAELEAYQVRSECTQQAASWTSAEQVREWSYRTAAARVRAHGGLKGRGSVGGIGMYVLEGCFVNATNSGVPWAPLGPGDDPCQIEDTSRLINTYVWKEWNKWSPEQKYLGWKTTTWQDETYEFNYYSGEYMPGGSGWVIPYYPVEEDANGQLILQDSDEDNLVAKVLWAQEVEPETWLPGGVNPDVNGSWGPPSTWWNAPAEDDDAPSITIALYYWYQFWVPPVGGFLDGTILGIEVELNVLSWDAIIEAFNRDSGAKGAFMVLDVEHQIALAHTRETLPDTAASEECQNMESTGIGGMGSVYGAACFPLIANCSNTSQYVAGVLNASAYDVLVEGTHGDTALYMRKHQILYIGSSASHPLAEWQGKFNLDVMWYRDAAEVQAELDERRASAQAELDERSSKMISRTKQEQAAAQAELDAARARMTARTQADVQSLRSTAEADLEESLGIMIFFMGLSFFINSAVSMGWVVLLAQPLSHLLRCVTLMGKMKLEQALAMTESGGGCEVTEVSKLRKGVIRAANLLDMYKSYMPASVFVDEDDDDTDIDAEFMDDDDASPDGFSERSARAGSSSPTGEMTGRSSNPSNAPPLKSAPSRARSPRAADAHRRSRKTQSDAGTDARGVSVAPRTSGGTDGTRSSRESPRATPSRARAKRKSILSSESSEEARPVALISELVKKHATIIAVNLRGYLIMARSTTMKQVGEFHHGLVTTLTKGVIANKGLTDGISGDRLYASVNGAKQMQLHRLCGVRLGWCLSSCERCVDMLVQHPEWRIKQSESEQKDEAPVAIVTSVCSGEMLCGNIGSVALRRYSFLGKAASWVHCLERLASRWGCACVANGAAQADANAEFMLRLRAAAVVAKPSHARQHPQYVWQVLMQQKDLGEHEEWMYQARQRVSANPWSRANDAWEAFYAGDFDAAMHHAAEGRAGLPPWTAAMAEAGGRPLELHRTYAQVHQCASLRPAQPTSLLTEAHLSTPGEAAPSALAPASPLLGAAAPQSSAFPPPRASAVAATPGLSDLWAQREAEEAELGRRRAEDLARQQLQLADRVQSKRQQMNLCDPRSATGVLKSGISYKMDNVSQAGAVSVRTARSSAAGRSGTADPPGLQAEEARLLAMKEDMQQQQEMMQRQMSKLTELQQQLSQHQPQDVNLHHTNPDLFVATPAPAVARPSQLTETAPVGSRAGGANPIHLTGGGPHSPISSRGNSLVCSQPSPRPTTATAIEDRTAPADGSVSQDLLGL